jgi:hypothetical protein
MDHDVALCGALAMHCARRRRMVSARRCRMGDRLTVGQQTLTLLIVVRIHVPQPGPIYRPVIFGSQDGRHGLQHHLPFSDALPRDGSRCRAALLAAVLCRLGWASQPGWLCLPARWRRRADRPDTGMALGMRSAPRAGDGAGSAASRPAGTGIATRLQPGAHPKPAAEHGADRILSGASTLGCMQRGRPRRRSDSARRNRLR